MSKRLRTILIAIFLIGALVRLADVFRPIDRASWRECDLGAVARNFATESMNIFYPRIDWRGNSPGYAEMEFPMYPFAIALTYKIFGVHDILGRVWAFVFSLLSMWMFVRLAREYLDGVPLIAASMFFAFNPMIVEFSTSVQPEGLMILFYVAAVGFFTRWIRTGEDRDFWPAAILTALALLAKLTAAHIGLLFAVILFRKYGLAALSKWRVWVFGLVALLPAAVWYAHAKSLWRIYGNSLGVSNEYHWAGADFFTNPYFIKGILSAEFVHVWSFAGVLIALIAVSRDLRSRIVAEPLVWLGSCFVLYAVAARTTADDWAFYYHIFSVPPAALLFGAGVASVIGIAKNAADRFSQNSGSVNLLKAAGLAAMLFAAVTMFLVDAKRIRAHALGNRVADESHACALEIGPKLTQPGLILVSGDRCFDPDGYQVAYNASFMFYWLERKGSNVCIEEQSILKVRGAADSGARYFIAQRSIIAQKAGFEDELRRDYRVVAECREFVVFDIGGGTR